MTEKQFIVRFEANYVVEAVNKQDAIDAALAVLIEQFEDEDLEVEDIFDIHADRSKIHILTDEVCDDDDEDGEGEEETEDDEEE